MIIWPEARVGVDTDYNDTGGRFGGERSIPNLECTHGSSMTVHIY